MFKRLRIKISDYKFEKRMARQRYKKGFSDSDCWGMNYWFVETFPKMIINLRDMKHGAPDLPFEEYDKLPEPFKYEYKKQYMENCKLNEYEYEEDSIFEKWYVILSRIAYCLQQADEDLELPNKYKEEYNKARWGEPKENETFKEMWNRHFDKIEDGYVLKQTKVDKKLEENYWKVEKQNYKYKEKMKNEAFKLLSKYFYNLWD